MGQYQRVSKREIYRNPWIAVEAHEIVHPSGERGEHLLISVPAASAVLVDDDGDLLFAKQPRFGADTAMLELVKGGSEPGEDPLTCAQRELREELGVIAHAWEPLGELYEIPSIMEHPIAVFVARDIEHVVDEPESVESIELVRIPSAQAVAAAVDGRIADAVTVAAVLRWAARSAGSSDARERPDRR